MLKDGDTFGCGEHRRKLFRNFACLAPRRSGLTIEFYEQLRIGYIGEQFNLAQACGNFPFPPRHPKLCDGFINERRADGTLFNRQQFVRPEFVIAGCKLGGSLYLQARAVAVIPLRRRMDLKFAGEFDLCRAPERFTENLSFHCELTRVRSVLVMAAAAALKVRTAGLNSAGRGLDDVVKSCPRESRLLLSDLGLDRLAVQNKGDKDAFARTLIVRREARQSVAAINEFLDLELQELDSNSVQQPVLNELYSRSGATMKKDEKKRLESVLRATEYLFLENIALKLLLEHRMVPNWHKLLERLLADKEMLAGVRLKFSDLYREIERSADPSEALDLFWGELPSRKKTH